MSPSASPPLPPNSPQPSQGQQPAQKGATPARLAALKITRQVRERNAFARDLIDNRLRQANLPPAERDFAILLILGVVACSGELDLIVNKALQFGSIKPKVRDALRISAYELFFLKKPEYQVVDQGVELVRQVAPPAAGLANKLLRQMVDLRDEFPFGDPLGSAEALAHQQAFPLWLAQRLIDQQGHAQAARFMEVCNQQAPLFLADLTQGTTLQVEPSQLRSYLPRIESGELIIADAAAQQIAHMATPPTQEHFLEVGSGRGTKTLLLMAQAKRLYGHTPQLVAVDTHAYKLDILRLRLRDHGFYAVITVPGDATRLETLIGKKKLPKQYAGALIDAPCSGTGTLRRHPEIRWRLTPQAISDMAAQGSAMLAAVAHHIQPGGFVVYSTCSVLQEENQQVIEDFLASEAGQPFTQGDEQYQSTLADNSPDAHFAVKLVREGKPL